MVGAHLAALARAAEVAVTAASTVEAWAEHLAEVLGSGGRLLACGNGGSAAEAQHLTGEIVGRFRADRRPYAALALHADTSTLTAVANDYGWDEVYARQVRGHGYPGDVLMAFSTSGTSANVLGAVAAAREVGLTVWSLTGPAPNPLAAMSDASIAVDAPTTATVQEIHLALVHALCGAFDAALGVPG
ncbi:MAG: SIS domain-containing protein [Actinomycetes bacterium]